MKSANSVLKSAKFKLNLSKKSKRWVEQELTIKIEKFKAETEREWLHVDKEWLHMDKARLNLAKEKLQFKVDVLRCLRRAFLKKK